MTCSSEDTACIRFRIGLSRISQPLLGLALISSTLFAQDLQDLHSRLDLTLRVPVDTTSSKSVIAQGNPKIDPLLRRLALDQTSKSIGDVTSEAKALSIPASANRIAVVVSADSEANVLVCLSSETSACRSGAGMSRRSPFRHRLPVSGNCLEPAFAAAYIEPPRRIIDGMNKQPQDTD